jgi:hypothetical protein
MWWVCHGSMLSEDEKEKEDLDFPAQDIFGSFFGLKEN